METIKDFIIPVLSLILLIISWLVKLKWSNEFAAAKNEIIRVKDEQIKSYENHLSILEKWNPERMGKYYDRVKKDLEENITYLDNLNKEYEQRVKELEKEIERLQSEIIPDNLSEQALKDIIVEEINNYRGFVESGKVHISNMQNKLEDNKSFFEKMSDFFDVKNSNSMNF